MRAFGFPLSLKSVQTVQRLHRPVTNDLLSACFLAAQTIAYKSFREAVNS